MYKEEEAIKELSVEYLGDSEKIKEAKRIAIKALEQELKMGHWINKTHQSGCGVVFINIECSECGESSGLTHTLAKYCPNCGVKMEVE